MQKTGIEELYDKIQQVIAKECGNEKCVWDCVECLVWHKDRRKEGKIKNEMSKM